MSCRFESYHRYQSNRTRPAARRVLFFLERVSQTDHDRVQAAAQFVEGLIAVVVQDVTSAPAELRIDLVLDAQGQAGQRIVDPAVDRWNRPEDHATGGLPVRFRMHEASRGRQRVAYLPVDSGTDHVG